MIRSWIDGGRLTAFSYPVADLDPAGRLQPLAFYLFHGPHGLGAMYQPLFPFLCGLMVSVFGFGGLVVVPVLCGLGTACVTAATARRLGMRSRRILPLVMGLATPLFLYSVVFWDHSALMLTAAGAGFWMLRAVQSNSLPTPSLRAAVVAGAIFGAGVWLHELFLALFAAAWLAALPLRSRRISGGLILGFLPVLCVWGLANFAVYGAWGGAHLGANALENNADHPFSLAHVFSPSGFLGRARLQLVGSPVAGRQEDLGLYVVVFAGALLSFAALTRRRKPSATMPLTAVCVAIMALALTLTADWVSGLFEATPLFIPALAMPFFARRTPAPESPFFAWLARACALFAVFMLATPMLPGVDWGARYLLTLLPFLTLLSARSLESSWAAGRKKTTALATAALVLVSLVCQIRGLLTVQVTLADNHVLNACVAALHAPVLVTDNLWVGPNLAAPPPAAFLIRSRADAPLLFAILRQKKAREFVYVGSFEQVCALTENTAWKAVESGTIARSSDTRSEAETLETVRFVWKPSKKK